MIEFLTALIPLALELAPKIIAALEAGDQITARRALQEALARQAFQEERARGAARWGPRKG